MAKRVAIYTFGCKLNQVDTEAVRESFLRAGCEVVDFAEEAEVYVVNTCTVTAGADHQARQMLRRALKRKEERPGTRVVAAGCYAQAQAGALAEALPGLDLLVGNLDKERIPELLAAIEAGGAESSVCVPDVFGELRFNARGIESFSDRSRAFLRIQEGCNRRGEYCIVTYERGRSRSAPPADALAQARRFAENGYLEIVLCGIHIGKYGADLAPETSLAGLLLELNGVEGIRRIRLSSLDPKEFSEELYSALDAVRGKLCPHFHISLQSGDDGVLRAMRRDYSAADFVETVRRLRGLFPDASIGADVIAGFPGESDAAFRATCELVKGAELSYLHVFRYSRRPGTPAADMPGQVAPDVKKQRAAALLVIRESLIGRFHERFVGSEMEVLLESRRLGKKKHLSGLTRNYLRVSGPGPDALMGKIVTARVAESVKGGLLAPGFSIPE